MAKFSVIFIYFLLLALDLFPLYNEEKPKNHYYCPGPKNWGDFHKTCKGREQSPIDLPCSSCSHNRVDFPKFHRSEFYFKNPRQLRIVRTVDSIAIIPKFQRKSEKITISGGPLGDDVYILDHIHFHWGDKNYLGSEHSINGKTFPMEIHAVFFNAKYEKMKVAEVQKDGIAIMAYLFRVVPDAKDRAMDCVTCCLNRLYNRRKRYRMPQPFPLSLLLPPFQSKYLTYLGSLTTPPCYESVTWIVHDQLQEISRANLKKFRELYCMDPALRNNYRPRQKLYDRKIYSKC